MREKIYYGDVDVLNIKTKQVITLRNVVYKANSTVMLICGKHIAPKDRADYVVKRFHFSSSKVIGESCI